MKELKENITNSVPCLQCSDGILIQHAFGSNPFTEDEWWECDLCGWSDDGLWRGLTPPEFDNYIPERIIYDGTQIADISCEFVFELPELPILHAEPQH